MKKLLLICVLLSNPVFGQIKGDRQIETRSFNAENLQQIEMGLYANVIIDAGAQPDGRGQITITTDSNLFEQIDTEVIGTTLKLEQLDWIQPSVPIQITINAPELKRLQVGVHETVIVKNITQSQLNLRAILGKIKAEGEVEYLNVGCEKGYVDATHLIAENAFVNIWDSGKATLNVANELETTLNPQARLELIQSPQMTKGDFKKYIKNKRETTSEKPTFITVKIRNNSWNRNHFVVKGPKPDGSYFGYGFPMMPGTVKKERWTVGTKVYKVNALGLRKLLITLSKEDENQTVSLFN